MEQYTQQPIIIEPETPQKKPVGLQITALVLGIVGMALAFLAYFGTIFGNVGIAVANGQYGNVHGVAVASGVVIIADILIAILCLVGLILGIVGLVKSIRRATRTVKGIVMSAIGLTLSEAGLALMAVGLFISGVFRILIQTGAFH